ATAHDMHIVGFGQDGTAAVRASDVQVAADGTRATISTAESSLPLHLKVLGAHHITNALAAIAASGVLGVPLADAIARIETVRVAERWRMQPMGNDRVRIINDAYNASPDS